MIDRLIDDWLAKVNERSFEVPFCQLLTIEGWTVLHIGHSPNEMGKDVIALDPDGVASCLQLKGGDINVSRWRTDVEPELDELVKYPIQHPRLVGELGKPYLVTTGAYNEPVQARLRARNDGYRSKGYGEIEAWGGRELAARFIAAHDRFLPSTPEKIETLLKLYLADGAGQLPCDDFAALLEDVADPTGMSGPSISRKAASAAIIVGYSLSSFERQENWWASACGWSIAASYIARLGVASGDASKVADSLRLCKQAAIGALERLEAEVADMGALQPQIVSIGSVGPIARVELTILAGALSVLELLRVLGGGPDKDPVLDHLAERAHFLYWGDSSIVLWLAIAWTLERRGRSQEAAARVASIATQAISTRLARAGVGIPTPYHDAETSLRPACVSGEKWSDVESTIGLSYTLGLVVHWLVRRNWKQFLRGNWGEVLTVRCCQVKADDQHDYLRWRFRKGVLEWERFPEPTEWEWLCDQADSAAATALDVWNDDPQLLLLQLMAMPHRATPASIGLLDQHLRATSAGAGS